MNNPLISPGLGTFFWMLISFGILVFILGKWGWPMLLKALKNREKAIADSLNAAEKAREEMKMLVAHNEDLLKEAKLQRDEMLRNARLTSDKIVEDARLKATEEADRIVENARENINFEKLKAMHELKNQIASLSIEIAEKLMKAELSDRQRAEDLVRQELENAHLN
ncbi:MAG: F0F1 ATP synthase subunit B [Bacteroidales bacterium]|nr:F0F1 ATP synthase subunit B [Bacteroidales bacterium]MBR3414037.1 F0F1 ATP synthase subunit B [Bacteroidales bacterium]